jgi:hypothetical protein
MSRPGGHDHGRSGLAGLTPDELTRAGQLLMRLDELAGEQRLAIARMAADALVAFGAQQAATESDLRTLLEQARARHALEGGGQTASAAERNAVAVLGARVRRSCQQNLVLLAHARRAVSLLLGIDEDRAAYDRRARRLSTPLPARVRAL